MPNYSMQEKLKTGEAIDVNAIGSKLPGFEGKVWKLDGYKDDVDYCDGESEQWMWSIGRNKVTDEFFAAIDTRFVDNPLFECVWLR